MRPRRVLAILSANPDNLSEWSFVLPVSLPVRVHACTTVMDVLRLVGSTGLDCLLIDARSLTEDACRIHSLLQMLPTTPCVMVYKGQPLSFPVQIHVPHGEAFNMRLIAAVKRGIARKRGPHSTAPLAGRTAHPEAA